MQKINWIVLITGEPKTGKTHMACLMPNSICIDLTANRDSLAAAYTVYGSGDDFEAKYYWYSEWSREDFEDIVNDTGASTIVIDTSTELRDLYAKEILEEINAERAKKKKSKLPTIYPVTEWSRVYAGIESLFRNHTDKNFIITANRKDHYVYDSEAKVAHRTGKRVMAGAKNLVTIADVVLRVSIKERSVGSPVKIVRERKTEVVLNRFLDKADEEVWIEYVNGVEDLMDKICEKSKVFKREMFI